MTGLVGWAAQKAGGASVLATSSMLGSQQHPRQVHPSAQRQETCPLIRRAYQPHDQRTSVADACDRQVRKDFDRASVVCSHPLAMSLPSLEIFISRYHSHRLIHPTGLSNTLTL